MSVVEEISHIHNIFVDFNVLLFLINKNEGSLLVLCLRHSRQIELSDSNRLNLNREKVLVIQQGFRF